MNFVEELRWRNMLHDVTAGAEDFLDNNMGIGYIGFDPTAPSLTIGNYIQIMLLSFWQKAGHKPIVLMGGATGRIGDPSGKDEERQLKSFDELDKNLNFQLEQVKKFLNFEDGPNKAEIINNLDFYKEMNVLDFLRNVGKTLTVNYMMSKDSVKNRLEKGLSFTEFSYQLLQGYDFQYLLEHHNCQFQMGGSDQWGNITSGIEFIRRNLEDAKAYAVTTPLLTKSDGSKFGKSASGNIWLDPNMTSPYKFYQFWINTVDDDLSKMLRYFSFKSKDEILALEETYKEDPNSLKRILAEEMTVRIHSQDDFENVENVSQILFNKKLDHDSLFEMGKESFDAVKNEIPSKSLSKEDISETSQLLDLLTKCELLESKGEGRRAIKNNALSMNKTKVSDPEILLTSKDMIHDKYVLIENGKKNKFLIEFI